MEEVKKNKRGRPKKPKSEKVEGFELDFKEEKQFKIIGELIPGKINFLLFQLDKFDKFYIEYKDMQGNEKQFMERTFSFDNDFNGDKLPYKTVLSAGWQISNISEILDTNAKIIYITNMDDILK